MAKKQITKKSENWIKSYWRPVMCWQYTFICMYDFFFAPLIYNILSLNDPSNIVQWNPITLQAGGFYHLAMGAIIGVYAWTRGSEKERMLGRNIVPLGHGEELYDTVWEDYSTGPYQGPPRRGQPWVRNPDPNSWAPSPRGNRGMSSPGSQVPEEIDDPDLFL